MGKFVVPVDGKMGGVRLVHLYGYVSCHTPSHHVAVVMKRTRRSTLSTDDKNRNLLPPKEFLSSYHAAEKWHKIPGYNSMSPILELSV